MAEAQRLVHPLAPVFDARSRVLILGTMPSPASRSVGFYYGHPRNRFWPTLAQVFGEPVPQTTAERRAFALHHRIALWDVLHSCEIVGASDGSIRNPEPNDVAALLRAAPIRTIATTGTTAARLYRKYLRAQTGMDAIALPSTSPANCRRGIEARLVAAYGVLRALCAEEPA